MRKELLTRRNFNLRDRFDVLPTVGSSRPDPILSEEY